MEYYDLGGHSRPVTTLAPEAQAWFDRGLVWAYGFNHEEAVSCFERALGADPGCAMAYWGVPYALGPNYNKPWEAFDETDLRTSTGRADAAVARAGQLAAAGELEAAIPEQLLRVTSPPMADWLEGFCGLRVHVLVRFGRWQDLLDLPLPADPVLYSVTTAMLRYGRGVAYSALGRVTAAGRERDAFAAAGPAVPASRTIFNNSCADILAIAAAMLDGELEYRTGNIEAAFAQLRESVALDDGLPYDEPWGWMQPARHAYGALLLEQGRVAEAEAVYRADLGLDGTLPRACQHPGNIWSLHVDS